VILPLHAVGGESQNLTADLPGCERMTMGIFRVYVTYSYLLRYDGQTG